MCPDSFLTYSTTYSILSLKSVGRDPLHWFHSPSNRSFHLQYKRHCSRREWGGPTCHQPTVSPTENYSKSESGFLGGGTSHGVAFFTLGFFSNWKKEKGLERMYSPLRGNFSLTENLLCLNTGLVFFENGKATQPEI